MGSSDLAFIRTALRRSLIGAYVIVSTPLLVILMFGLLIAMVKSIGVPVRLIARIL
jgi:hypothetical protein